MDEVGIYRLSGATSEVRKLKDAFDNSKYLLSCVFRFFQGIIIIVNIIIIIIIIIILQFWDLFLEIRQSFTVIRFNFLINVTKCCLVLSPT